MTSLRRRLLGLAISLPLLASCTQEASVVAAPETATTEDVVVSPTSDVDAQSAAVAPAEQAAPSTDQPATSIRDIDFLNEFVYASDYGPGDGLVTVQDGSFANGDFGDPEYFSFTVTDVEYGDLDRDGVEDALVATSWNGGGTGHFDSVSAFRLVDGRAVAAGTVLFGDRADGGIYDVVIEGDVASVWAFSTTLGACCANQITQEALVLGEHWITRGDRRPTRTWLSLAGAGDASEEVKFMSGTSSAVVTAFGSSTQGTFTFEAGQGQRVSLNLLAGPAAAEVSLTDLATGQVRSLLADMVLSADGNYEVTIAFAGERTDRSTFELVIDNGRPTSDIDWFSVTEQTVITEEPFVRTSLLWPEFISDQPGTTAANAELAAFATRLDDFWIEDVTVFSNPQDDSSYEAIYDVTLATTDLVSVRFNYFDYVCCRAYPNYGPAAAVLDLTTGQLIPAYEIVDLNRFDELLELWLEAQVEQQGLLPESLDTVRSAVQGFDSIALFPEGIEFGTPRGGSGGGSIGTLTILTYEQLGDLVNSEILDRLNQ